MSSTHYFWDNCNACGLCVANQEEIPNKPGQLRSIYQCSYLMDTYFTPDSKAKCELVNHCEKDGKDKCQGLSCLPMFGNFRCQCGPDKYGTFCEHSAKVGVKYAVIEDILVTPTISPEYPGVISILFRSIGTKLRVHIKTLVEFLEFDSQLVENVPSVKNFCKKWYIHFPTVCSEHRLKGALRVLNIRLLFGRRSSAHAERPTIDIMYLEGFIEKFTLAIYNNDDDQNAVFKGDYNMYTTIQSPTLYLCYPIVSLRNVGKSMLRTIKIVRKTEFVIVTSYKLSPNRQCHGSDNIQIHWNLWKLTVNHNPLDEESALLTKFKSTSLHFDPYSLEVGQYKIRCNISVWLGVRINYDFIHGYFEIIDQPIEAIISGGSERTLYFKTETLTLDGKLSTDPNLPHGQQKNLLFYWKCDQAVAACKGRYSEGNEITIDGPFEKDTTYSFSLIVFSGKNSGTATQKIRMIAESVPSLKIWCKKNCGVANYLTNPREIVYFEVIIDENVPAGIIRDNKFTWTFRKEDEGEFQPVDEIRQADTPDSVLIVLENKLSESETYMFQVKGGASLPGETSMKIKMASKPNPPDCSVYPEIGSIKKGQRYVEVYCNQSTYKELPVSPIFNIYDKFPNEAGKGKLIYSSKSPASSLLALTRGTIVVSVKNHYGLSAFTEYPRKLTFEGSYEDFIFNEIENLENIIKTTDEEYRASTIATIMELIASENITSLKGKEIPEVIESMLQLTSQHLDVTHYAIMKIWTETVESLAVQGDKFGLTVRSIKSMGMIVDKLAKRLLHSIRLNDNDNKDISNYNIVQLSQSMLRICDAIYVSKNEELHKQHVDKADLHEYLSSYKNSTVNLLNAIDNIMLSLSIRAMPYQDPIEMKFGDIALWAKEDSPQRFYSMSNTEEAKGALPAITISRELANSLGRALKHVSLQIASFNGNPFWWDQKLKINTYVVDLKVRYRQDLELRDVTSIQYPIDVRVENVEMQKSELGGSVEQPDPEGSIDIADSKVAIHKLRVPHTGRLELIFNLTEGDTLKVLAMMNKRPDYDFMQTDSVLISASINVYEKTLKDPKSHDLYDLYYLGVLPGPNVAVGHSVNYSFEMSALHCVTWMQDEWSTHGCGVKNFSNSNEMSCECNHLSSFGGFTDIPMNTINPFKDYVLFLGLRDNLFVFICILSLLILYLVLLIWARRKDIVDKYRQSAIYLEDNFPQDKFMYLVAIYTGSKLGSGTTSNVGITVQGDQARSRAYILRTSVYRALQTAGDDWFIMFAPSYLGKINLIHLWIDHTGRSPEWFCNKVFIVDLSNNDECEFIVNSWFSLRDNEYVEKYAQPQDPEEDDQNFYLAVENLVFGFREGHLWGSVFSRHPRSSVTRTQRLSVAFTGLLVTMLVSAMFYGVLEGQIEENPTHSMTEKQIIIGLISMIVSAFLINITVSVFRRTIIFQPFSEGELEEDAADEDYETKKSRKITNTEIEPPYRGPVLCRFVENILKAFVAKKKFVPVHLNISVLGLPSGENVANGCWSIMAWSVCFCVILMCSYLIILYGLTFGKVKSLEWLSTIVVSFVQMVLIGAPIKIISLAAMSGLVSSTIYQVVSYHIDTDVLEKCKEHFMTNNLYLKAMDLREDCIYRPLSYFELMCKHRIARKKAALWRLLDMGLIAVVAVVTLFQNQHMWTAKHFWTNEQMRRMLGCHRGSHEGIGMSHTFITNITMFPRFLENEVFPIIYQIQWYNKKLVEDNSSSYPYIMFSGDSKLYGLPRLRQSRLKPGLCMRNVQPDLPDYCPARLTASTEDTDLYGEDWVTTGGYELFAASTAWQYANETEAFDRQHYGYSNLKYSGGGYVVELAKGKLDRGEAEDVARYLDRQGWLDMHTAALFMELSTYNPSTATFTWLVHLTESLHIGTLLHRVYVVTVDAKTTITPIDIIFLVFLTAFSLRVVVVINRQGLVQSLTDFWTLFECVIVSLSVYCAYLYYSNLKTSADYLEEFSSRHREEYFKFIYLLQNLFEIKLILVALVVMIFLRLLKSWRFADAQEIQFYTLGSSWRYLAGVLMIIIIISFVHWRLFSFLVGDFMFNKNTVKLISKIDYKVMTKHCNEFHCKFNRFLLCFITGFYQILLVTMFVFLYRVTKDKMISQETKNINIWTTLFSKRRKNITMSRIY